jgi:hypothetical protein
MPSLADLLVIGARLACGVLVAGGMVLLLREIRKGDPTMGAVVAGGVLLRAAIGATLFWISYLDLPVLSSLHSGDGFWQLAPDARSYHHTAERAVREGWHVIASSSPSPTFTRLLAAWMWLVGVSPASGLFLNLLLFTASSWLVVRVFRPASENRFALILLLGAYSYLPAAVLFSVQALKDQLVLALVLCMGAAMWMWTVPPAAPERDRMPRMLGPALLVLSVFLVGGIRSYFAALVVFAFLAAALPAILQAAGLTGRLRAATAKAAWVVVLWMAFAAGSGPYHAYYESLVARAIGLEGTAGVTAALGRVERARTAFVLSGGDTNIAAADELSGEDAVGGPLQAGRTIRRFLLGVAVTFVPIHVVQWTGQVSLRGGRGLLLLTDIDTAIVLLVSVVGVAYVLRRRSAVGGRISYVVFCGVLATSTILLMAYVVTNYGTLFRLRLFPLMALWMLPLAVSSTVSPAPSRPRHFIRSGMSVAAPQIREN